MIKYYKKNSCKSLKITNSVILSKVKNLIQSIIKTLHWEVTDEVLNALLFMLIGLEMVVVDFRPLYILIGLIATVLLLIVRFISLWIPAHMFRFKKGLENKTLEIMTWGGLRGGISIALALSLPNETHRDIFVGTTFVIVLFSILVQGLTIERFVKILGGR
jgi:Na+:H+ antiporter